MLILIEKQHCQPRMFATIEEVQDHARQCLRTYNNDCPYVGLGGITPAQKMKLQTAA